MLQSEVQAFVKANSFRQGDQMSFGKKITQNVKQPIPC
jgi:hypothetical protein